MRYRTPVCWPAATASASGCNGQGCNGRRREGKGPWLGREKRKVGPAAGAKFIGSVVPITLISHRFECQTRRFFAILRGGPRSVSDGRHRVGGIGGAVTAQLIGRPDSAPAGGRSQGRWHLGRIFCLVLFNDLHKSNRKTKRHGRFLSPYEPWMALRGRHGPGKRGAARFAGELCGKGEGPFGGICHWRLGAARV